MKLETWHQKCQELYDHVYKNGVNFFDYVCADNDVEKLLNQWFNDYVKCLTPPNYSLIARYNAEKHLMFEKSDDRQLVDESEAKDCMLLLSCTNSCLFYLKDSIAITSESIEKEIEYLFSEIAIFRDLHMDTLNSNDIRIKPIILLVDVTKDKLIEMPRLEDKFSFIITKEELRSKDTFERCMRKCQPSNIDKNNNTNDMYSVLLSRILGWLSLTFKDVPHIDDNSYTLMEKIPLTKKQKYIINTDSLRHVILTGSYGTGKTLVMQKRIFRLVEKSNEAISIYILLGDSVSLLYGHMKQLVENYKAKLIERGKSVDIKGCKDILCQANRKSDVEFYLMSFEEIYALNSRSSVAICHVLQWLTKRTNTHIFIDEFDAETLTDTIADELCDFIKKVMKDSTLFIIPQPLHVYRSVDLIAAKIPNGFCFGKTMMEIIELDEAIRNSQCVYELFKEAKDVIQEYSTTYYNHNEINNSPKISVEIGDLTTVNLSLSSSSATIDMPLETRKSAINVKLRNDLPVESLFKKTYSYHSNATTVSNAYRIESKFRCGNAFQGNIPTFYVPFDNGIDSIDESYNKHVAHLRLAFSDAHADKDGCVIVCSSIEESKLCYLALADLSPDIYLPSLICYAPEKYQNLSDSVLITDFKGVRGTELKNVLIILSTDEYFFAPFFLEVMTRAVNQLSFVLFNFNSSKDGSIAIQLMKRWQEKNLIRKVVIACSEINDDKWNGNEIIKRCILNHHDSLTSSTTTEPFLSKLKKLSSREADKSESESEIKKWLSRFVTKG